MRHVPRVRHGLILGCTATPALSSLRQALRRPGASSRGRAASPPGDLPPGDLPRETCPRETCHPSRKSPVFNGLAADEPTGSPAVGEESCSRGTSRREICGLFSVLGIGERRAHRRDRPGGGKRPHPGLAQPPMGGPAPWRTAVPQSPTRRRSRPLCHVPRGGSLMETCTRTLHGLPLLRPGHDANERILGVLGRAAEYYGVNDGPVEVAQLPAPAGLGQGAVLVARRGRLVDVVRR